MELHLTGSAGTFSLSGTIAIWNTTVVIGYLAMLTILVFKHFDEYRMPVAGPLMALEDENMCLIPWTSWLSTAMRWASRVMSP